MNLNLGFDLDLVVYASDIKWMEWLQAVSESQYDPFLDAFANNDTRCIEYDLSNYYRMPHDKVSPFDFWRNEYLYYDMPLVNGAKETIDALHRDGHNIYFISNGKGNHHKSKYYRTKQLFPYNKGVAITKEKGSFANGLDVFIDDRNSNLNQMPNNVKLIKMYTPYTQDEELNREHSVCYNWKEIYGIIKGEPND